MDKAPNVTSNKRSESYELLRETARNMAQRAREAMKDDLMMKCACDVLIRKIECYEASEDELAELIQRFTGKV